MIGNDIIDILEAGKIDWRRKGYLKKIFTEKEKDLILSSNDPYISILMLWSMKESAYKIYFRQNLIRLLNPVKFECSLTSINSHEYQGEAVFHGFVYKTFSKVSEEYISTAAIGEDQVLKFQILSENIKYSTKDSHLRKEELYSAALKYFSQKTGHPINNLTIQKNLFQIPFLVEKTSSFRIPISFSHHGSYAGYAIIY